MKETIIGIDLGTTNSEVAVIENGQPVVLADSASNKVLPSFVGVGQDAAILVGEAARNQYAVYPERTVKSIKRKMGSDEKVEIAGDTYTPQEISAFILKRLKTIAESHVGQPLTKAVITVPAYFNDAQRQATREAGEIAGFEVMRMINEPTAAALSYESGHKSSRRILVYDLGGGTFDVSVVQLQDGVVEVISSHGNNQLGGDDFDQKIVEFVVQHLNEKHNLDIDRLADSGQVKARILRAAIDAKQSLSNKPYVMIEEEFLASKDGVPVNLSVELSREAYEEMITPYIDETLDAIHIALKDASLTPNDIDEILLVGGSTRTPLISRLLAAEMDLEPHSEVDPDLCVATGAAIQAGMIAGENVSSVLVDVTPYTFGTSVFGELNGMPYPFVYSPIIKKNTVIPVSRSEVYFTMHDNQEAVQVRIYQGEDIDAQNNVLIGEFKVEGLSKAPANSPIIMELELDVNGILNVTALEKSTGLKRSIRIEKATSRMDEDALEKSREHVDALSGAAEGEILEDVENNHADTQARKLVDKAEQMLENATEDDRDDMVNLIESIKDALQQKDEAGLKQATEELSDIVYYLET